MWSGSLQDSPCPGEEGNDILEEEKMNHRKEQIMEQRGGGK